MSVNQGNGTANALGSTTIAEQAVNGINVTALSQTVEAVQDNPAVATFRFKVKSQWLGGPRSRSIANEFHGAMQDIERAQSFLLDADEPAILLGSDEAPNAGEYLLHALAACVTSSIVFHAAVKGIAINEIESKVEGEVDLRGFLGIDDRVRNGFKKIRMSFDVGADVDDQQLQELVAFGPGFSPVFDSISNGVPIDLKARRMQKK